MNDVVDHTVPVIMNMSANTINLLCDSVHRSIANGNLVEAIERLGHIREVATELRTIATQELLK